jgi:hypothetical protein
MTFWLGVAVAYSIIIAVGLAIGLALSQRFPRRDGGTEYEPPVPAPTPGGGLAIDLCGRAVALRTEIRVERVLVQ